jgi:hypothetical protein
MSGAAKPTKPTNPTNSAEPAEPAEQATTTIGSARRCRSGAMAQALTTGLALGCLATMTAMTGCAAPPTQRITDAATSPLSDLNLMQVAVPPVLVEARKQVYAVPVIHDCIALATEIHALDEALGPDLDVPASANDKSLVERGGVLAGNAALDAIKGAAEGLIPYRSWVRKLSGAERASKAVAAAIGAGMVRRGFLKGLLQSQTCH